MTVGKVTGSEILPNKDGLTPVLLLQCEITDPDDVQSVELFRGSGIDENPLNGSRVIIIQISESWKIGIALDDGIIPSVEQGEKELYSAVGAPPAAIKFARIKCLKDGSIEIVSQPGGIEKAAIRLSPIGTIEASNGLGNFTLDGVTGQVDINGNFTVDP